MLSLACFLSSFFLHVFLPRFILNLFKKIRIYCTNSDIAAVNKNATVWSFSLLLVLTSRVTIFLLTGSVPLSVLLCGFAEFSCIESGRQ